MRAHVARGQNGVRGACLDLSGRDAVADDVAEIVRVINLAYRVEDFFVSGDRTTSDDVRRRMSASDACFLVVDAMEANTLAGAVWMEIKGERCHFAMLSVDPSHQGKGVARALINGVESRSRDAGCAFLDIEVVNLRLELPSFYQRLGFTESGVAEFAPADKLKMPAHLVLMTKRLD